MVHSGLTSASKCPCVPWASAVTSAKVKTRLLRAGPVMAAVPAPSRGGNLPRPGVVPAGTSADDPDVFRLGSLLALRDVELDLLPFLQAAVAATGDRAEVHEHVRATLDRDETVALVAVEPLHSALRHLDLLRCGCGTRYGRGSALATIAFGQ